MNCRDKCRDCRFSCSGSQSRTKGIGRPSFGSGSSSGSGSRPSGSRPSGSRPSGGGIRELTSQKRNTFVGSRNCDYTCERNGGCKVTYVGPPRAGRTQVRLELKTFIHLHTNIMALSPNCCKSMICYFVVYYRDPVSRETLEAVVVVLQESAKTVTRLSTVDILNLVRFNVNFLRIWWFIINIFDTPTV